MIIFRCTGGLGNQLFQYAAAKALAVKHSVVLKADTTWYETDPLRQFELPLLGIMPPIATAEEIAALKATTTAQRLRWRFTAYQKKKFYKQPHFGFDKNFFMLGSKVYLQGYFQSPKYFAPIEKMLRDEIIFPQQAQQRMATAVQQLQAGPSVSVHLRRGDYRTPEAYRYHGILPATYYKKAIAQVKLWFPDARFYLFTNDAEWAETEMGITDAVIAAQLWKTAAIEDLYLMSCCHHHIIANSSFSWWAAWLNNRHDKKVIAPKQWFNKGPQNTTDLVPAAWLRL